MARPIWKGQIRFGLVQIPVVLHSAEDGGHELRFNMLDQRNNARIRYERVNESTGEEVPWDEIVKAYKYDDTYVVLSDADFKRAAPEATKTVEIEGFVEPDAIDPIYFDKPYYLVPDKRGEKAYVLLRDTLKKKDRIGLARVVIRTKEHLAAVRPFEHVLLLNLLRFQHEIRPVKELNLPEDLLKKEKISAPELAMAAQLVESMNIDWKPEKYRDEYYDKLMKWIEQKAASGKAAVPASEPERDEERPGIVNIMDLLKKSLAQQGNGAAQHHAARRKPAAHSQAHVTRPRRAAGRKAS